MNCVASMQALTPSFRFLVGPRGRCSSCRNGTRRGVLDAARWDSLDEAMFDQSVASSVLLDPDFTIIRGGSARLAFEPAGLSCEIDLPLERTSE